MADSDALHVTRTKVLSVVEIQKVLKSRLFYQLFSTLAYSVSYAKGLQGISTKGWKSFWRTSSLCKHKQLLEFDFRTCFFELFLGGFCVGLWDAFFDVLRSAVHQVLGFFQAKTCQFAHGLDDLHFLGASL